MFEIRGQLHSPHGTKVVVAGEEIHDVVSIHFEHELRKEPKLKLVCLVRDETGQIKLNEDKTATLTQVKEW